MAIALALSSATLAADVALPLGFAGAVAHMLPVLLTLWIRGVSVTIAFAIVGSALTVLGHALSPSGGDAWQDLANRALAIGAVVATAGVVVLRKSAASASVAAEQRFRGVAEALPGVLWIVHPTAGVVYFNAYGRALVGIGPDEEVGGSWDEMLHPDDRSRVVAVSKDHLERIRSYELEFRLRRADGGYAEILARGRPYFDDRGQLLGYAAIGTDITAQKNTEAALRETEAFLSRAQSLAQLGSWVWEAESNDIRWSEQMYRIVGLPVGAPKPSVEEFGANFLHPDDRDGFVRDWNKLVRSKVRRVKDRRIVRPDGEVRYIQAERDVDFDERGRIVRISGTLQDVTERRHEEQALRESRERLVDAEAIASIGHSDWDVASGREVWSDELYRLLGAEPGDLEPGLAAFLDRIVGETERARVAEGRALVAGGKAAPGTMYRIKTLDGRERDLKIDGRVFTDESGNVVRVFATAQDVTELRDAERALRRSEERFELAARGTNDGLWDWPNIDEELFWLSDGYLRLLGYQTGALEFSSWVVLDHIHPDDVDAVVQCLQRHVAGDGEFDIEHRLRTSSGEYRWFRARGGATRSEDGTGTRVVGSSQDIHDQRMAQLAIEHHQAQLRHLATRAALAGEKERRRIGAELHDRTIQNLGVTKVKLGALRESAAKGGQSAAYDELAEIVDATIQDARALLSEISPPVLNELGFEAAVDWLAEKTETQYGVHCTVSDDGEPRALDDDAQLVLFQTVRELLANVGKHACAGSARVAISGGPSRVVVRVVDDGIGFEPTSVENAAVDDGGYGLFSIRERLRMLGGVLQIESRPDAGTSVTVSVPIRH